MSISKVYINNFVGLFGIICILVVCCLISYLISPNNYIIVEKKDKSKLLGKALIRLKESNIKDEDNRIKLDFDNINNRVLRFKINEKNNNLNYIFENRFKSQSINISEEIFIEVCNSDVIIVNNNSYPVSLKMYIYEK